MSTVEHPRGDLAALALGALDPPDRAAVEAHLVWCGACRAELADLRDGAGLLGALGPADLAAALGPPPAGRPAPVPGPQPVRPPGPAPGPEPVRPPAPAPVHDLGLARLLRRARDEAGADRRRSLRRTAVAAAAALVIGAGGATAVTAGITGDGAAPTVVAQAPPGTVVLTGSDPATGTSGEVTVQPSGSFVRLALAVQGVAPGTRCRIVVVTRAGERVDAGSWTVGQPAPDVPRRPVDAAAAVPAADVAAVEVETLDGERVVTLRA